MSNFIFLRRRPQQSIALAIANSTLANSTETQTESNKNGHNEPQRQLQPQRQPQPQQHNQIGQKSVSEIEWMNLCSLDMDIERPIVSTNTTQRTLYVPHTFVLDFAQVHRLRRLSILPSYPTTVHDAEHFHLLLSNVPADKLTAEELARRTSGACEKPFELVNINPKLPSFYFERYEKFLGQWTNVWRVDMAILDYNYVRLLECVNILAEEQKQRFKLRSNEVKRLSEDEYAMALEFYLQIDVDMFFMKTCTYRNARTRSSMEGLFCHDKSEARYEWIECGNCTLCYPRYEYTLRSHRAVQFSSAHKHQFINKYQAILNCPASCATQNLIYALTCPCGRVDYVGETSVTLGTRLSFHRAHGNRIMHECFLGQEIIHQHLKRPKSDETKAKDNMALYQHSTQCQTAIQIFLDLNPQHWRFVPMTYEEAEKPEEKFISRVPTVSVANGTVAKRTAEEAMHLLLKVPKPPDGYCYSNRQQLEQFEHFRDGDDEKMPNVKVDLYDVTLIAVLPENGSDELRRLVEALFITHAETKLNSSGRLVGNYMDMLENVMFSTNRNNSVWCHGLIYSTKHSLEETMSASRAPSQEEKSLSQQQQPQVGSQQQQLSSQQQWALQQQQQQEKTPRASQQEQSDGSRISGDEGGRPYQYLSASPPDPRLPNPRLLEDYVDWYHVHYMKEEHYLRWIDIENKYYLDTIDDDEEEASETATTQVSPSTSVVSSQPTSSLSKEAK